MCQPDLSPDGLPVSDRVRMARGLRCAACAEFVTEHCRRIFVRHLRRARGCKAAEADQVFEFNGLYYVEEYILHPEGDYDPDRPLEPYVRTQATWAYAGYWRRQETSPCVSRAGAAGPVEQAAAEDTEEDARRLEGRFRLLGLASEEEREAVRLFYAHGLSAREIADWLRANGRGRLLTTDKKVYEVLGRFRESVLQSQVAEPLAEAGFSEHQVRLVWWVLWVNIKSVRCREPGRAAVLRGRRGRAKESLLASYSALLRRLEWESGSSGPRLARLRGAVQDALSEDPDWVRFRLEEASASDQAASLYTALRAGTPLPTVLGRPAFSREQAIDLMREVRRKTPDLYEALPRAAWETLAVEVQLREAGVPGAGVALYVDLLRGGRPGAEFRREQPASPGRDRLIRRLIREIRQKAPGLYDGLPSQVRRDFDDVR